MAEVVLVTQQEFAKAEAIFRAARQFELEPVPAGERELAEAVRSRRSRAVIVGGRHYEGPLYEALAEAASGRGAIIARFGVGHDGIDKRLAAEHNITVTNTPGVLEASVAEHTLWLIGSLVRRLGQLDSRLRAGEFAPLMGQEIHGKTLGVVGFGAIGRRVAAIAHFGFGMNVLGLDSIRPADLESRERRPLAEILAACGTASYSNDLSSVLGQADIVSLHLPSTPQTRHLIDADRLGGMRPESLLVNTARGAVLDEIALHDALAAGKLAGAGLDVFENEPYRPAAPGKDLRTLSQVVLTPHVASNTREANDRMARAALANVAGFFEGRIHELSRVELPKT